MAGDQQEQQHDVQDQAGANEQGAAPAEMDDLAERVQEAVTAALAEQRDMVLRAQAEIQNMRRRCEADVEKAHKFALEKFSAELLTVVDNLERALNAVGERNGEQVNALAEGVELTLKSFLEILNKFNVQQVNPVGEPFDPQVHQAITTIVNPNVEPNTVLEVMQKGYTLHGRVIRPAMVVVSKTA
jgi:molecular chaperone GrpE